MHISMDSFPLSLNKIRAVRDMLDDPAMTEEFNEGERRSAFNLLWTFPVFHSRWSQLTAEDFHPQKNLTRGAIANNEIYGGEFVPDDSEKGAVFDTVGVKYLRRAIEECQSRGIEVLVTFLPLYADAHQQAAAEYAGKIAAEYGVDYINFFDLDLVNYHIDFADSAGHLNTAGARKVTEYLGNYIAGRYGIPDHRGEAAYADWERDHLLYTQKKNEALCAETDLYRYLMLLERDAVDAALFVRDTELFRDPIAAELLGALGVETGQCGPETKLILTLPGDGMVHNITASYEWHSMENYETVTEKVTEGGVTTPRLHGSNIIYRHKDMSASMQYALGHKNGWRAMGGISFDHASRGNWQKNPNGGLDKDD